MSALPIQSIVDQLLSAGFTLSLTTDSRLKVSPASGITPALRDLIGASKAALVDYLEQPIATSTTAANDAAEPFSEPPGYEGTGWLLAGADDLSPATLAKFRAASLVLDAHQSAYALQLQGTTT